MQTSDSIFRKVSLGAWRNAADPTVYGLLEFDTTPMDHFLGEKLGKEVKISPTIWIGMAVAHAIAKRPEVNRYVTFWGLKPRKQVDVFFQTMVPGADSADPALGSGLTGVIVRKANELDLNQFVRNLSPQLKWAKQNEEHHLSSSLRILNKIPTVFMGPVLSITAFLNYDCGVDMTWAGMPRDPFGSVFITNVGSLGADCGWAPLVPFTRVPLLFAIGQKRLRPWVTDSGNVEVRPVLRIGVSFDHRVMDGAHAAQLAKDLEFRFANPSEWLTINHQSI